jgi:hypothetical protein
MLASSHSSVENRAVPKCPMSQCPTQWDTYRFSKIQAGLQLRPWHDNTMLRGWAIMLFVKRGPFRDLSEEVPWQVHLLRGKYFKSAYNSRR